MLFQRCESGFFVGTILGCAAFFGGIFHPVAAISALLLAGVHHCKKKIALALLAGAISGGVSAYIQNQIYYPSGAPDREFGVENIQLRLCDPRLCSAADINAPALLKAEVETPFRASVFCRFPATGREKFHYGDLVSGTARIVPVAGIEGSFGNYLRSRKVEKLVYFQKYQISGNRPGIYGQLLAVRDKLIARSDRAFKDSTLKNLAAALFFGISGGIGKAEKREFINSGTVHLFSVSGMHVAVIASLLLLLCRFFSYRTGYALLIAACGIYTLATGANTPALRAFFMITVWAVLRMNYLWMRPLDVMSLCGALFLLINPFLLADTGAQYSFVITAALLLTADRFSHGARREQRLAELAFGATRSEEKIFKINGRPWAALLIVPLTAFFAGAGITILGGGRIIFGQIVANILLLFLTLPLFVLLIFCGVFPGLGVLAENFLFLLRSWCTFCAGLIPPVAAGRPQVWLIAVYYLLLFITLSRRKLASSVLWAIPMLAILFYPLFAPKRDVVMVITSDSKTPPCVLFVDGSSGTAEIVNIPTFFCAKNISGELHKRGIGSVGVLHAGSNRVSDIDSLNYLDFDLAPEKIVVSGCGKSGVSARITKYLQTHCQRADAVKAADYPGKCRVFPLKNGLEIEYFFFGSKLKRYLKIDRDEKVWRISFHPGDGEALEIRRNFGVPETVWSYEF